MINRPFLQALDERVLVCDGAMTWCARTRLCSSVPYEAIGLLRMVIKGGEIVVDKRAKR